MRVLLDENLPEPLVAALRPLGHEVDSVDSLRRKGLDNGTLYREIAQAYDLCFTKDAAFARSVSELPPSSVKLLRVTLPQTQAPEFVDRFVQEFRKGGWERYKSGDDWPQ